MRSRSEGACVCLLFAVAVVVVIVSLSIVLQSSSPPPSLPPSHANSNLFRHKPKKGKHGEASEAQEHRHFSIIGEHAQLDLEATGDSAAEVYKVWLETLTLLYEAASSSS